MPEVVIVDALRTPFGAVHGAFAEWHPVDLLAEVLRALGARTGIEPFELGEIVVGCIEQVGGQGNNVARGAALAAGWPHVVSTTVEAGAVTGIQALRLAAALAASGARNAVVVGAVDLASLVPPGAAAMGRYPYGRPWGTADDRKPRLPPGVIAETLARRLGIGRAEQDAWAHRSIIAAVDAQQIKAFRREIHGVGPVTADEWPGQRPTSLESITEFPPLHETDGTITAANSAPMADGAAAALVADAAWARARGLPALATLLGAASTSGSPDQSIDAAVAAAHLALERAGIDLAAIDIVEVHDRYAAIALAIAGGLKLDLGRVNPRGGALAMGDAIATSGLRGTATLAHVLARSGAELGLLIAAGTGEAAALVLQR